MGLHMVLGNNNFHITFVSMVERAFCIPNMITILQVIFGFIFVCFIGGVFFYIIFDLKPWRRDSQLWNAETDVGSVLSKSKIFAQEKVFSRNTWRHFKSYYAYYGLALIMIAILYSA